MVREVVVDGDAAHLAHHFEPPLDPAERAQAPRDRRVVEPHGRAHGDGRQRVAHVVLAHQRQIERAKILAAVPHREVLHAIGGRQVVGGPVGVAR